MKFIISVFPGLTPLATDEIKQRLGSKVLLTARVRGSELLWLADVAPRALMQLRLVEDVFAEVGTLSLTGSSADLHVLAKTLSKFAGLNAALNALNFVNGRPAPNRQTFRVVVQADDAVWRMYRRVDIQTAAEGALAKVRPQWRLDRHEAPLEIWIHQYDRYLTISVRLSSAELRSRGGRLVEREAALRPTIAAAMVWASGPAADDVFLDPMCGSGTILLERALYGRHGLLLGGDIDPRAVKAALVNFGPRHKPVRISKLDARSLPYEDASVDAFVTNLPWGRQIGVVEDLPELYGGVLREAARVLRPAGTAVLLTSEWKVLKQLIVRQSGLKLERTVNTIEVLGRRADMFVLRRV